MHNKKAVKCYEEGRLSHQQGNLQSAERAYKKAIKINNDFVEAHNNLGNVLLDRGRFRMASQAYRDALRLLPNHPMLLSNLGNALQLQGESKAAVSSLNKALVHDPDYADAHHNLGNSLRSLGDLSGAESSSRRAIQINPDRTDTHINLGNILFEQDQLEEAVTSFRKAIETNSQHKDAYIGLGNALSALGQLDESIASFRKAIEIDPKQSESYDGLANALSENGEFEKAIDSYNKAISIYPENKFAFKGLGDILSDYGETDKAIASYRTAISIDAEYADAYRSLSNCKKYSEHDEDIRSMESLYSAKIISDDQKMHLAFGLGKAYEDLEQYEKSMAFIIEANSSNRKSLTCSISVERRSFQKLKDIFSRDFFSNRKLTGNLDSTPIFILGMPRSGTSLVEQILASHPDVFGSGELFEIHGLSRKARSVDPALKYPESIPHIDSGLFEDLGKKYITRIRNNSEGCRYITDKMPHNFLHIGFIKAILPNARIIHCTRDPMDICLSMFKNYFGAGHSYSYDMTKLGEYFNLYIDLMEHWKDLFPNSIYDLNYEKMVTDQEEQTRKLLEYCDLSWNDNCLNFHNTRRKVKTASNAQVRRSIYSNSVNLWKRYEKELQPLQMALSDSPTDYQ